MDNTGRLDAMLSTHNSVCGWRTLHLDPNGDGILHHQDIVVARKKDRMACAPTSTRSMRTLLRRIIDSIAIIVTLMIRKRQSGCCTSDRNNSRRRWIV